MARNQLTPQASAVFQGRFENLLASIETDITQIKQQCNSRGLLFSSGTVREIYGRVDATISDLGKMASDSAKLAYEAGKHSFSENLESDLLDVFEDNFSLGYERLCAIRVSSTQSIRDSLLNKQMHESDNYLDMAQRATIEGQLELRQYFQLLKRSKKRWYEHIPFVAKLMLLFFKLH